MGAFWIVATDNKRSLEYYNENDLGLSAPRRRATSKSGNAPKKKGEVAPDDTPSLRRESLVHAHQ
jgi:hypothetical protein